MEECKIKNLYNLEETMAKTLLENLEYPLDNYKMEFSRPLGISNIMKNNSCNIRVDKGSIIIIKNI